jgi:putative hemolysin
MKRIILFTIMMMALTACTAFQVQKFETTGTGLPPLNMANPASVFCVQNGNKHEIRTAADGSQTGICVFPNGSTCDEWAYFRGECPLASPVSPTPTISIEKTKTASGGITEKQGSGGYMPPGSAEKFSDWWGVIKRTKPGAQFDDYFERRDLGQVITFGIDSIDPAVKSQIVAQRDSGKIVHLYGTLLSNVPDYNGSQVQVDRIEVEG